MTADRCAVPDPCSPDPAVTLPVVRRLSPALLDAAEMPCVDCFIGEPHVCRWLVWDEVTITQDEWGGYVLDR